MRWLIDGYNVIRRDSALRVQEAESLERGRAALLRLVAGAARASGDPFVVVFDGARRTGGDPAGSGAQVQVIFSRPPESADDVLVRLAGQWREGAVVVSADRTVQSAVRRAGAVAVTTDEFLAAIEADGGDGEEPERASHPSRGNPRRLSRDARAAQRVLRRLRSR
jgi:predicted RNA-binding protein with PIN domain